MALTSYAPCATNSTTKRIGLLGARSLVGQCLLSLLRREGWAVSAYSRQRIDQSSAGEVWRQLDAQTSTSLKNPIDKHKHTGVAPHQEDIAYWISLMPIWELPHYFGLLQAQLVQHVVAVSSTSRYTKNTSSDPAEQILAQKLTDGETQLQAWAQASGVSYTILRPTLTYGYGRDKSITQIARFINRYKFFPLFGKASGLRQPLHADDLAQACVSALVTDSARNHAYNLSGAETLTYREMVRRVFIGLERKPRVISCPLPLFRLALTFMHLFRRQQNWSLAMAQRMNQDLVFNHTEAVRDLAFTPRGFTLEANDLPSKSSKAEIQR